ncbi:murein transglycosylase, partial [Erwinia amylovora]|nr:murein transglycosylase [Erwinia amylovora]
TGLAVNAFIKRYPTLPPVASLPARFVNQVAAREDWRGLLVFSPQPPKPVAARCNWYYAKWSSGHPHLAGQGAKDIWLTGSTLPAACDKLFN